MKSRIDVDDLITSSNMTAEQIGSLIVMCATRVALRYMQAINCLRLDLTCAIDVASDFHKGKASYELIESEHRRVTRILEETVKSGGSAAAKNLNNLHFRGWGDGPLASSGFVIEEHAAIRCIVAATTPSRNRHQSDILNIFINVSELAAVYSIKRNRNLQMLGVKLTPDLVNERGEPTPFREFEDQIADINLILNKELSDDDAHRCAFGGNGVERCKLKGREIGTISDLGPIVFCENHEKLYKDLCNVLIYKNLFNTLIGARR